MQTHYLHFMVSFLQNHKLFFTGHSIRAAAVPRLSISPDISHLQESNTSSQICISSLYTPTTAFLALWADGLYLCIGQATWSKEGLKILQYYVPDSFEEPCVARWKSEVDSLAKWPLPKNPQAIIPLTSCTARMPLNYVYFICSDSCFAKRWSQRRHQSPAAFS